MICPVCQFANSDTASVCQACAAPLGAGTSTTPDALPAGTRLQGGSLVLEEVLGIGGFGITYRGQDTHLHRAVAVKEFFPYGCRRDGTDVHPPAAMPEAEFQAARRRFLDEAKTLAQFRHPGIVDVYTLFEENNSAYMVMEFLRGQTLGQLLEARGRLREAEALAYIQQAAQALDEVHRGAMLHRDIKPDNIFATDDGRVVLIDFGTAREFAIGKTRQMTVTLTPGYAPLEQYAQRAQRGPYSDVYALAATLYHLLTGEAPLPATDRAAGVELADVRELNLAVSAQVASAVMGGLAMEVAARPQSAREMLDALTGRPGAAGPVQEEDSSWWKDESEPVLAYPPFNPLSPAPVSLSAQVLRTSLTRSNLASFMTIAAHSHKVTCLAFSPDGRTLASAGHAGNVKLWDRRTGELKATLEEHSNCITSLAFSPDGNMLASSGHDGTVRLWNPRTGQLRRTLRWPLLQVLLGRECWMTAVAFAPVTPLMAFTPDTRTIACGSGIQNFSEGETTLWNAATGVKLRPCRGDKWVNGLAFTPDGKQLAGATADLAVKVWDVNRGDLQHDLAFHEGWVADVAYSPDGRVLASASEDTRICLWDMGLLHCERVLSGHSAAVTSVAFDKSGNALASGSYDHSVRLWDTATGDVIYRMDEHHDRVNAVAISPDGHILASGSDDHTIKLWRIL